MILLIEKIKNAVEKFNMIKSGDKITIALSGGADSVSLLLALNELKDFYGIELYAFHVNHQLRGSESNRDEEFCHEICTELRIPFSCVRIDVASYMKKSGMSCEESARFLRYEALNKFCRNGKIATAHTLSDNAETVVNNLIRGTGLKGLTGIPPVRNNIIRPLIFVSRDEVESYLKEKSQNFVTDRTNLTDDYTRNKIRHHIIPEFQKINSSFLKTTASSISALQLEDSFISQECDKAYSECLQSADSIKGLEKYHKAIRCRCISKFLSEHNIRYSYNRISAVDSILLSGGKINIAKNVYIISERGMLFIEYVHNDYCPFQFPVTEGQYKICNGKFCNIKIISDENFIYKNYPDSVLDYDKINGAMIMRSRKYGDKIRLAGKQFTSSVKKTLINMKIPANERMKLCFIEDESGLIFAEKIGIADHVKPEPHTKNFLVITTAEYEIC